MIASLPNDWLAVGRLVAPQGLQGEVRIQPLTDFPERLTRPGRRLLAQPQTGATLETHLQSGRSLPGRSLFVCRFTDLTDRTAVEAWVGATIASPQAERPALAKDEFWLPDLIDAVVYRRDRDERIGTLIDLRHAGNDLLVVRLNDGSEVLIPFVTALVPEVDVAARRVVIDPIPGLLEPDTETGPPQHAGEDPVDTGSVG